MIPNFIFENLAKKDPTRKKIYIKNILEGETHRKDREVFKALRKKGIAPKITSPTHIENIINYDNQHSWDYVKNKIVENFKENHTTEAKKFPVDVLTQYVDGIYDILHDNFDRESYDNDNMIINVFKNFGEEYNNAFWDGMNLCFGNGDGIYFNEFIIPDIIAHEFGHGIQDHETGFVYFDQSGALNEHVADVFGMMFDQIYKKQDAKTSKWLIGEGLWTSKVNGIALRSMKEPGTAYDDEMVGKDPQPGHMDDYVETTDDDNGVHINSGIPNRAFYLMNMELGNQIATNGLGRIWYETILKSSGLGSEPTFQEFAQKTYDIALTETYGLQDVVARGWAGVGINVKLVNPEPPVEPPIEPPVEEKEENIIIRFIKWLLDLLSELLNKK